MSDIVLFKIIEKLNHYIININNHFRYNIINYYKLRMIIFLNVIKLYIHI